VPISRAILPAYVGAASVTSVVAVRVCLERSAESSSNSRRVARPIAKRRAGHLGWIASPDGGINSLLFASGCGPVRFDLDYSLFSGHESEAADRSVRSTQTNPPDAPPIHALPGFGECSAASPRVFGQAGQKQVLRFAQDDKLWVGGRGIPPLAKNARTRTARLPKIRVKGSGQECPLYTNLGCLLYLLTLSDLDGCFWGVGGDF
jgi:hypothetical protein